MKARARPSPTLPSALGNLLAALLAASALAAQEPPGTVTVVGTLGVPVRSELHPPTPLNVPQVPKAALGDIPKHTMPPIPVVPGHLPQPNSPPATLADAGPGAPGDFRFWKNVRLPFGASTCCPEPSVAIVRDTAFATANTFGALSHDSGQTWRMINPATRFPSVDGGVCCDQRVLHTRVSSERLTIWYMQYARSSTTGRGSIRIAVAAGRDGLRSDIWRSWVFQPEHFGQPNGRWLDFPDVSASTTHLYCASNVFDFSGSNTNSVLWRIPLAELAAGGAVNFIYYTRTGGLGGGGSFRFAQTSGATMYWATHVNTATMRVYRLPDTTTTASYNDRSVPAWSNATRTAPSPNGVNWIGFQDARVMGGYNTGPEYGFLWSCAQDASHPFPFIRVARFRTSDHTLIAADDVWSSSTAFAYPGACTNGRGDRGVVLAAGSSTLHVRNVVFLVDQYAPGWGGQQLYSLTVPTRSPTTARWGDYFTCHIDDSHPQTFLCSGAEMDADGNAYARYAWFSREADMPVWIDLNVGSTPITNVPIEVDVADRFGRSSGNTPFSRTYARNQGYRLTAPLGFASGGAHWGCVGWSGSGGTTTRNMIEVSSLGSSSDTMTANYAQAYEVTVNGPSVLISVSPRDIYEDSHGTPLFRRYYTPGTVITMTAPATNGRSPFRRWSLVRGTTIGRVNDPTLVFTMGTEPASASAQYWPFVAGSVTSFGTGCQGSNGLRLTQNAAGAPEIGTAQSYSLQNARPSAPAWFILGLSNSNFAGLPLPFDNAPIGAPGCFTYCSHDMIRATIATSSGSAINLVGFPNQTYLIGARIYTQYFALDAAANQLGLTMSNAYTTVIGGVQQ